MVENTKNNFEKMLYLHLRDRGIEKDSVIPIMLELSQNGDKYEEFYSWLISNESATEEEIFEQLLVIVGKS